jgi:hypothetical protein
MRLPNKINNYNDSILSRLPIVLSLLKKENMSASSLYEATKKNMEDVGGFLEVLDCLYALGKIEFDIDIRMLRYVD